MDTYSSDDARWDALLLRDPQADGSFVYAVTTTGIYCRPTCASKRPNRENVRFFDSPHLAESAGYRPCQRCEPHKALKSDMHRDIVIAACRQITEAVTQPTLQDLARAAGYSPAYFHRLFKKIIGLTPKQYASTIRANRVRNNLQSRDNVTQAIYDAGFNASSRFYDTAPDTLGMKPTKYRQGGQGTRIRHTVTTCYLGWVLIAATDIGVCALEFGDSAKSLEERLVAKFPNAEFTDSDNQFEIWVSQVLNYLESPADRLELPLDIQGTVFQQRVWQALREIPAGHAVTYSQIAERIDQPSAARAVARACATNRIAIAIPCHRVIRRDGDLGGYKWGIDRKQQLLARESKTNRETE